jgi:hypothetical protein
MNCWWISCAAGPVPERAAGVSVLKFIAVHRASLHLIALHERHARRSRLQPAGANAAARWNEASNTLGRSAMQIESPLKPRTDALRPEAGSRREGCCAAGENPAASCDAGRDARAPVWDHVISRLLAGYRSEAEGEAYLLRPRIDRAALNAPSRHVQVEVIERLSDTSIAVLWQDATRCRYADQVWIACRARLKGRCALSGAIIRRNDPIYKPRVRSAVPVNAGAMILASVIACMPCMGMKGDAR